ncbi:MAG: hypothetical protein Q8P95_02070 [bacterium]|nr:hypothetical protein [bacterium]
MGFAIICPSCDHKIVSEVELDEVHIGDYLECETCFEELVVSSVEPIEVEPVDDEK